MLTAFVLKILNIIMRIKELDDAAFFFNLYCFVTYPVFASLLILFFPNEEYRRKISSFTAVFSHFVTKVFFFNFSLQALYLKAWTVQGWV